MRVDPLESPPSWRTLFFFWTIMFCPVSPSVRDWTNAAIFFHVFFWKIMFHPVLPSVRDWTNAAIFFQASQRVILVPGIHGHPDSSFSHLPPPLHQRGSWVRCRGPGEGWETASQDSPFSQLPLKWWSPSVWSIQVKEWYSHLVSTRMSESE